MKVFTSLANPNYGSLPFTDFASINPDTDLSSLNLNWREADLPERERTKHVHRLHPYLGKFIPQLAEIFLRKFRPSRVYDPFCGCGTTLIEANALGIESVGSDISKFNCMITQAKSAKYDLRKIESELHDALFQLSMRASPGRLGRLAQIDIDSAYLKEWFHPNALHALTIYRSVIERYEYQELMSVILCRAARSARLTTHHNLDFPRKPQREPYYCRKHKRICKPTTDAYQFLSRYTLDTIDRVKEFAAIRTEATIEVLWGDARYLKLPEFDMILTSPPYVGLIDYHEQHRYAYELLNIHRRDEDEIGAAFKGTGAKARERYLQGIREVYENARRYLRKGGVAVTIIGDRHGLYTSTLANEVGFREVERLNRHVNRRTGRRNADFFEDVLVWEAH